MTIVELRNTVIVQGIASVQAAGHKAHEVEGALAGFALCRSLITREEFAAVLAARTASEFRMAHEYHELAPEDRPAHLVAYQRERYCTLQIEHVQKVLQVAWGDSPVSARAVQQYAEIVGVQDGG